MQILNKTRQRKIFERLLEWKANYAGKTALLIDGARRVGKSYIVTEFAEKNYKSYILWKIVLQEWK